MEDPRSSSEPATPEEQPSHPERSLSHRDARPLPSPDVLAPPIRQRAVFAVLRWLSLFGGVVLFILLAA